ncbi:MAG: Type-1 restriction enzyme EcoKI specificity protein [Anaerolineales bacterium]|nr:Type-1 restriction enzyme EcoKI specificity protein [Anaerolineales bacterium]HQU37299.1 restriction endonuclease subunit S [Anaerolineales bacterium]
MSYELVPIGELGEIVTGSTPDTTNKDYWDGDIPWITPANLTSHEGIYFTGELRKITKAGYKSCSTKMMPAGSIVFSTRAPIGHCAVTSFPLCTNQGFKSIVPNERLDAVYGFFALKYFTPQLEILGRGATFAEVNKETFENFRLPLPPLTEQKRIASLLARADRLRSLRRTGRALGESLLQSVFLEMFGDGSKFDRVEFEEILEEDPKNGLYLSSDQYGSGTPIIRIDAFYDGVLGNPSKFKRLRASEKQIEEFKVQNGEILINRVNSLEYLGKCALVKGLTETTLFESNMMKIRINRKLAHPVYVTKFLTTQNAYSQILQKAKKAVNQASINQQDVKSLVIPVPPLPLQEEFASVVARVEGLRGRMSEAERQGEGLFESLLAESFA